jgi:Mg2+ and Co2+ transporter CorA
MDVVVVRDGASEPCPPARVPEVLAGGEGFVWVDVPALDEDAARWLSETFAFHPLAVKACSERTHVPKLHTYGDHVFVVLHAAERGEEGHVHLLQVNLFVSERYLVTVHGPLGEGVALETALVETGAVRRRLDAGRLQPRSPGELGHTVITAITRRLEGLVSALATEVAGLERRVRTDVRHDTERVLEELFLLRHELLTLRTMAAQGREVLTRLGGMSRDLPGLDRPFVQDLVDQYARLRALCDEEKEFLQGVVDFYQAKTTTKMNIAMERLALIAALVLPVTAVASIYGMNLIVSDATRPIHLVGVLVVIGAITFGMLRWTRKHGWW